MKSLVAILLTISLTGCAVQRDFLGNAMPPECRDLSGINIPVVEVSSHWLDKAAGGETGGIYGLWSRLHVIYIRNDLRPDLRARVIAHELCHEAVWRLTGSPEWHGAHPLHP